MFNLRMVLAACGLGTTRSFASIGPSPERIRTVEQVILDHRLAFDKFIAQTGHGSQSTADNDRLYNNFIGLNGTTLERHLSNARATRRPSSNAADDTTTEKTPLISTSQLYPEAEYRTVTTQHERHDIYASEGSPWQGSNTLTEIVKYVDGQAVDKYGNILDIPKPACPAPKAARERALEAMVLYEAKMHHRFNTEQLFVVTNNREDGPPIPPQVVPKTFDTFIDLIQSVVTGTFQGEESPFIFHIEAQRLQAKEDVAQINWDEAYVYCQAVAPTEYGDVYSPAINSFWLATTAPPNNTFLAAVFVGAEGNGYATGPPFLMTRLNEYQVSEFDIDATGLSAPHNGINVKVFDYESSTRDIKLEAQMFYGPSVLYPHPPPNGSAYITVTARFEALTSTDASVYLAEQTTEVFAQDPCQGVDASEAGCGVPTEPGATAYPEAWSLRAAESAATCLLTPGGPCALPNLPSDAVIESALGNCTAHVDELDHALCVLDVALTDTNASGPLAELVDAARTASDEFAEFTDFSDTLLYCMIDNGCLSKSIVDIKQVCFSGKKSKCSRPKAVAKAAAVEGCLEKSGLRTAVCAAKAVMKEGVAAITAIQTLRAAGKDVAATPTWVCLIDNACVPPIPDRPYGDDILLNLISKSVLMTQICAAYYMDLCTIVLPEIFHPADANESILVTQSFYNNVTSRRSLASGKQAKRGRALGIGVLNIAPGKSYPFADIIGIIPTLGQSDVIELYLDRTLWSYLTLVNDVKDYFQYLFDWVDNLSENPLFLQQPSCI